MHGTRSHPSRRRFAAPQDEGVAWLFPSTYFYFLHPADRRAISRKRSCEPTASPGFDEKFFVSAASDTGPLLRLLLCGAETQWGLSQP
jgi:hypothetical protein